MNADVNPWLKRRSECADTPGREFNDSQQDSQFQRDRARIIHSASFRSLQSKTQVLGLGESDFYRTRLTHSLEVAQIGSGVCEFLRGQPQHAEFKQIIPTFSLIEAICLAHDIGHSPFGHGGEVAMNTMMKDHGGFEANGQSLRILARLGEYSAEFGLDLTRRTMLGIVKYPVFYSDVCRYRTPQNDNPLNIDHWSPPKCIYDSERDLMDWLLRPFSDEDRDRFLSIDNAGDGHSRSRYKSFDTSIMELADDIAYGVHDLEDALALGLVDRKVWQQQVLSTLVSLPSNQISDQADKITELLFSQNANDRKHAVSRLVAYLIRSITIVEQSEFSAPLLRLQAQMESVAYRVLILIKDFVMQHVILRPELQMLQFKGQRVVVRLFEIFAANPNRLLPHSVEEHYQQEGLRAISDYLSGMTDVSAGKLYHKLLSPTAGSIFDRS
ncbi:MAG: deoxyguanosinetriphosphate triphosphohydrolase family protein [Granulosicoccus sp.]|nr:deoxyguanosinetriphosphate triphosphohydrolase family protein [Granulosicoccus sp.]